MTRRVRHARGCLSVTVQGADVASDRHGDATGSAHTTSGSPKPANRSIQNSCLIEVKSS